MCPYREAPPLRSPRREDDHGELTAHVRGRFEDRAVAAVLFGGGLSTLLLAVVGADGPVGPLVGAAMLVLSVGTLVAGRNPGKRR